MLNMLVALQGDYLNSDFFLAQKGQMCAHAKAQKWDTS